LLLAFGWPLTILVALLLTIGALRDRLSSAGLDPGRLLAAAGKATHWRDLGVQLAFRDRFKQALSEVTAALGKRTLIILIDDLDRCRPDQIAEVLEAINFLSDTDGCFVAFGFARPQILAGIGLANREIAAELSGAEDTPQTRQSYAEDYLRKLIQIEVPVPRFNAPAAERLVETASDLATEPRPVRAWLPALSGLGLLLLAGLGMLSGHHLYSVLENAWNAPVPIPTEPIAQVPSKAPVSSISQITPRPGSVEAVSQPMTSAYLHPGDSAPWPRWVLFLFIPALGLGILAAILEGYRPHPRSDDDSERFTKALRHWAVAAYEVRQSPREMKRFLNRLRFAAAGRVVELPDDILVGLAVLHHAEAQADLANIVVQGPSQLRAAVAKRAEIEKQENSSRVFGLIHKALAQRSLAASGLPPFKPTSSQVQTFLALWEGVKAEA
jgi:hypothetical protein